MRVKPVSVRAIGYQPGTVSGVRVALGSATPVSFQLSRAAVSLEAIEVTAGPARVDVAESGVRQLVTQDEIEQLPSLGRDFVDFINLSGLVAPDAGTTTGGQFSIAGQRASQTSIQIDGVDANNSFFGENRGGARIHWIGSTHEREDLACSDCHNPMAEISAGGLLREAGINRTCFSCHPQQSAEFRRRSHMPLHEGKIDCADCHNPHGSDTDPLLREISVNHLCANCHAEKRGPFLWEHAPVRESCLNCHLPHGSNHEMLLASPRPFLCQQCHSQISFSHPNDLLSRANIPRGPRPDVRIGVRSCTNCHAQIHGSNHPSGVRFHR